MTRLKQPGKTYWRDDGMKTNIEIGLGKVLGMASNRSLRREAKYDIGIGTHKARPQSTQKESKVLSLKRILIWPSQSRERENTPPEIVPILMVHHHEPLRKTSTIPVYHLITLDSDSDTTSSISDNGRELLPQVDFIPSSAGAFASVMQDVGRTSETDKLLEDESVKFTLNNKSPPTTLERKNTIDVKRYRVFRTRVDV